jgi:uncharacterized protein HemX
LSDIFTPPPVIAPAGAESHATNKDAAAAEVRVMLDEHGPSRSETKTPQGRSAAFIALSLLAFVCVVVLGVYATIPMKEHEAPPPDPTAQAIHDLQTSLHQAVDQLKAMQQTVSSDQAETKQLSDQIAALSAKLNALQESFANAQQAPVAVPPVDPSRPKRGAAR